MIEASLRLMDSADELTGPVNLGNPGEFTILQLARHVIELTGSRSEVRFAPLPSDDPVQRQPDITLAREALGWTPAVDLDDGLRRTIRYFQGVVGSERVVS
jgi:UDP-glucuronate decarboxylase